MRIDSKGFGFLTCGDIETKERILSNRHVLHNAQIDCNNALVKTVSSGKINKKKVFLGRLDPSTTKGNYGTDL